MPKVYVLVGVPASGKSTWIENQDWTQDCVIVSTDIWVEIKAKQVGKTYSEIFQDYMPHAVKLMANQVTMARDRGMDIIWDQTSTTVASRKKKFKMLPDYEHIAVVFPTPDRVELNMRLANRPDKVIPAEVVDSMIASFQLPTKAEGYTQIIVVGR